MTTTITSVVVADNRYQTTITTTIVARGCVSGHDGRMTGTNIHRRCLAMPRIRIKDRGKRDEYNARFFDRINRRIASEDATAYLVTDNSVIPWQINKAAYGDD